MHANRDSQHRAHCDQICTNMSIGDCTVVSTPVIHNIISSLECTVFAIASRYKPCTWPCVVSTFPKCIRYILRKLYSPSLCNLKNRSKSFYKVQTDHSCRHGGSCLESGGESAATEVSVVSCVPCSSFHEPLPQAGKTKSYGCLDMYPQYWTPSIGGTYH